MVLSIAHASQPHAAAHHRQFTVDVVNAHRLAGAHLEGPAMKQFELRVHHQSPIQSLTILRDNLH
jgi:hypothetical protein